MTVSRETSLSDLLSRIANKLNFNKDKVGENSVFSGLTPSAASLTLLSINHTHRDPALVVFDNSTLAEKLYRISYHLLSEKIALYPETVASTVDIPGFNLENERYRSESINFFRKNTSGLVFTSLTASNVLAIF